MQNVLSRGSDVVEQENEQSDKIGMRVKVMGNGDGDSIGRKWQKWDFIFLKVPPYIFKKSTHNKN